MSDKTPTPWADWADENHKAIEAAEAASEGAPHEQGAHQARCSPAAGSPARDFAEMFKQARRNPHYWCEAIELSTTKKQRMSLAREIAAIVKAAQENIPGSATGEARSL